MEDPLLLLLLRGIAPPLLTSADLLFDVCTATKFATIAASNGKTTLLELERACSFPGTVAEVAEESPKATARPPRILLAAVEGGT